MNTVEKVQQALENHKNGALLEAENLYRQILGSEPANIDALHLLGALLHQRGDNKEALSFVKESLRVNESQPHVWNTLSIILRESGQFKHAAYAAREALRRKPNYSEALNSLGSALRDMGMRDDAKMAFECALELQPGRDEFLINLGCLELERGNPDTARDLFEKLGSSLQKNKNAQLAMGQAMVDLGLYDEAFEYYVSAYMLDPSDHQICDVLNKSLSSIVLSDAKPVYATVFELLLIDPKIDPQALRSVVCSWLELSDDILEALSEEESITNLDLLAQNRVLLRLLEGSSISVAWLEDLYRRLRVAVYERPDARYFDLSIALALQAVRSDYIFHISEQDEGHRREAEKKALEVVAKYPDDIKQIERAMTNFAMWSPLTRLEVSSLLLQRPKSSWSSGFNYLLDESIRLPGQEVELAVQIPCITPMLREDSREVQDHYDTRPYQKWDRAVSSSSGELKDVLKTYMIDDHDKFEFWPQRPNVLVGGSGTGQKFLQLAKFYPELNIDALDISIRSLAYSMRRAKEFDVSNVRLFQCDLSELSQVQEGILAPLYQYIDLSSGVLNEIEDKVEVLTNLSKRMSSDGLMLISLKTTNTVDSLSELRSLTENKANLRSEEGIRKFRFAMINDPELAAMEELLDNPSYFSFAGMRRVLDPVAEFAVDLAELEDLLKSVGLVFKAPLPSYRKIITEIRCRYAEDKYAEYKLANWVEFEKEKQHLFPGNFEFLCAKLSE